MPQGTNRVRVTQEGSPVRGGCGRLDHRNLVWLGGRLYCLDAGEGGVLHEQLVWPQLSELRTIQEADLGLPLADVAFLSGWPSVCVS
eukprot:366436-Chlamydomonas_euryale.AAC.29